ncbi:MAG: PQQ-binding-like beta-propeller repeat protein, partial [Planctomycetota bacterium]
MFWCVVICGGMFAYWLSDADQDRKNSFTVLAYMVLFAGLSIWTVRSSGLPLVRRWILASIPWLLLLSVSPFGPVELINNGNVGVVGWQWRWAPAPDERLAAVDVSPDQSLDWQTTETDYPAFLGGKYWAEVDDVAIDVESVAAQPPELLWNRRIGAGWSGFAVVGDYAITQEQRGEEELVTCYDVDTGELVWSHSDQARHDPGGAGALGGVGPRATPTVAAGRVFSQGATGIINCLDARSGELLWSHDTLEEYGQTNLLWGKAGSPAIADDLVIFAVGGDGVSVVAYRAEDGEVVWSAGDRRASYASPVVTELCGVRQVVTVDEDWVTGRRLDDGGELWEHPWPGNSDAASSTSNPVPVGHNRLLLSKGYGVGAELIRVLRDGEDKWSVDTIWKKPVLKTKMSNVLVRDDWVFGIDDVHLSCIALEDGAKRWKKR